MSFFDIVFLNGLTGIVLAYAVCYFASSMLKTQNKAQHRFIYVTVIMLIYGAISAMVFEINDDRFLVDRAYHLTILALLVSVYLCLLIETREFSWRTYTIFGFLYAFCGGSIEMIATTIAKSDALLNHVDARVFQIIINNVAIFLFYIFAKTIFTKMRFDALIDFAFETPFKTSVSVLLGTVFLFFDNLASFVDDTIYANNAYTTNRDLILGGSIFTLLVFALILSNYQDSKAQLNAKNALVFQQLAYVRNLEEIHHSIQELQVQYKNIIQQFATDIQTGNLESLEASLAQINGVFDAKLQKKIKETSSLQNIENKALRSLIMAKMMQAEHMQVGLNLEVVEVIGAVSIETNDLIRSVGILIDNALEALIPKQGKLDVILLNDDGLKIIIKNPVMSKVNLKNIFKLGYSSKGTNRGLGLSSYQKICDRYPNITRETQSSDNEFMQTVHIRTLEKGI